MTIKLVIFDLDGVLVDLHDAWYESWKQAFESVGKRLSVEDFDKRCWGSVFPAACRKFGFTDEECDKGVGELLNSFMNKNVRKVKAFPGSADVLASLGLKGIKRALVTNNRKEIVDRIASLLGFSFELIVDLSKAKPKPSPEGIELILKELNIDKEDGIFIGDTEFDEQTGRNAGIKTYIIGKHLKRVADILKLI